MGELAEAVHLLAGTLPENTLIQFPSGRWGFVGNVRADLVYTTADGSMPTNEQLRRAVQYGPRLAGLIRRAWNTREEALDCM